MKSRTSSREITSSSHEIASKQNERPSLHRGHPDIERTVVVFVDPHASADALETVRRTIPPSDAVYRRIADAMSLPRATQYFFLLDQIDHAASGLLIEAVRTGATVTLIANAFEPHFAAYAERPNVNVVPMCGDPGPIGAPTLQRAIAMVLAGERVAARGFVQHSLARQASDAGGGHPFVAMLHEASVAANTSTTVVAAVLALQRTGSNFLHDMIGLSVSARVRNFHEHDVPGLAEAAVRPRPPIDPRLLERDGRYTLRQALLRDTILTPERRYIFVSDRSPEDRLLSYFVKGRSDWLHQRFDASRNRFRDAADIQHRFDEWTWAQLDRQRKWYRNKLLRPFGLNVLEAERIDGLLIGRHRANTLIVVPTARLNRLVEVVSDAFRTDCYRALAHNSAKESGDEAIGRVFREQFTIDPDVAESLWAIPEVAHIHGAQMLPLAANQRTFSTAIRRRAAPAPDRRASLEVPAPHTPEPQRSPAASRRRRM
jgi:hypothetical protein